MKKILTIIIMMAIFFESTAYAFCQRTVEVTEEKKIPLNIISENQDITEYIDVSDLKNVSIVDTYIDNGEIYADVKDGEIQVELYDGKYSAEPGIVIKTGSIDIQDKLTDESTGIIIFKPEFNVDEILDINGDFLNAELNDKGEIVINVDKNSEGIDGFDKNQTEISTIDIKVNENNTNSNITSEYHKLDYPITNIKNIKVKNVAIEAGTKIETEDNKIRVSFSNGRPIPIETSKTSGYPYFWIDRDTNGKFRVRYPNSIYRADNYYFKGEGEYLSPDNIGKDMIIEVEKEDGWNDYCGVVINDTRYVHLENADKKSPNFSNSIFLDKESKTFTGQWFNTEKLKVEFGENSVKYMPFGKLYSMGNLIDGTKGWGSEEKNQLWESKESFINPITGLSETYVKHFKFFYGPNEKITFGGYYTYPYACTIAYEHYKPVKMYAGNVTYNYEEYEDKSGYSYNGWVKIRYSKEKQVNDYPPKSPYAVKYDAVNKMITWKPGSDDYTPYDKLTYQIEGNINNNWQGIGMTDNGILQYNYESGQDIEFRIRAIDEMSQYSDWAYNSDSAIELKGYVIPQVINKGENIDIKAITKSISDITKVEARCEELLIDTKLQKGSENIPDFYEIAFGALCNLGKRPFLVADNEAIATNNNDKKEIKISPFFAKALTEGKTLNISFPDIIPIEKNGTIIIPNQNYLGTPIDFAYVSGKWWYVEAGSYLKVKNKNTGAFEDLFYFYNDLKMINVNGLNRYKADPYIKIHTFTYGPNNSPIYNTVPIDIDIAGEPISVTWKTEDSITNLKVYIGSELIYTDNIKLSNIINNIEGISEYDITKRMKKFRKTTSGYGGVTGKDEIYVWPAMAKAAKIGDIKWLGYKIESQFYDEEVLEEYNNLPTTRDINRILILNEEASEYAIKKYLKILKGTNIPIKRGNKDSALGGEVLEKICTFEGYNLKTNSNIESGIYFVDVIATNAEGEMAAIKVPVVVGENYENEEPETPKQEVNIKEGVIGRFFYKGEDPFVEELSKTDSTINSEGFICAGETILLNVEAENSDYLVVDINGDKSIIELDTLTQRFLINEAEIHGRESDIEKEYNFPVKIYPEYTDETGKSSFIYLYTLPYKTKQTLESWSSLRLKSGSAETIDENKLFERIRNPYEIVIYPNGEEDKKIKIPFDVFERWDTVLNRDATEYINNSDSKWRYEIE